MKKGIITLSIISVLALLILIVYLVAKNRNSYGILNIFSTSNDTNTGSSEFPLKYSLFVKSDKVKDLQSKLNKKLETSMEPNFPKDSKGVYIKSLAEDGYFGDNTLAVIKYFFNGSEEVTEEMFNSL